MNKILSFLSIITFFALFSCTENKPEGTELIKVDIDEAEIIPMKDGETIQLETSDSSLVSYFGSVVLSDSMIVISSQNKVLAFNSDNGQFLFPIGRKGQGPGEYANPLDLALIDGEIVVYDFGANKYLRYTLKGDFVSSQPVVRSEEQYSPAALVAFENAGPYVLCKNCFRGDMVETPDLSVMNDSLHYLFTFPQPIMRDGTTRNDLQASPTGVVLFAPIFTNTIYSVVPREDGLQEAYTVDFGAQTLPESVAEKEPWEIFQLIQKDEYKPYCTMIEYAKETEKTVWFAFVRDFRPHLAVYDRESQQTRTFGFPYDTEQYWQQFWVGYNSEWLYFVLQHTDEVENNPVLVRFPLSRFGIR